MTVPAATNENASIMVFLFKERYIDLRTDFGFKRIFGTEANKQFTIDFLNSLLPPHHQIQDLTFKQTENLGLTPLDRRAIFDVFCQGNNGDQFIVEMQRTSQAFYKDRSLFYASFPIQEHSTRGDWDYQLTPIYSVSVLNFVMNRDPEDNDFLHTVTLKDQHNKLFYDKLTFIYVELPKFKKTLEQILSPEDKWFYLFRHLPELTQRPQPLDEPIFDDLFEIAKIANFSSEEQDSYQAALKAYRDFTNVMNTAIREAEAKGSERGMRRGMEQGIEQGIEQGERSLILRQLSRRLGEIPQSVLAQLAALSSAELEELGEALLGFQAIADLEQWLIYSQEREP
ncbi:MAG: Rpn family recombination-promoting nuclease/putative transposase [Leptolyngbyaceae cyanobacterium]